MGKAIQWIIAAAVAVAILLVVVKIFKNTAAPLLSGSDKVEHVSKPLSDDDDVLITTDDNIYHRTSCVKLRGPTQRSTYAAVKDEYEACQFCVRGMKDPDAQGE